MELSMRKSGETYIVDVKGEMDLYNAHQLKELVNKMLEKKINSFVINMEAVEYIDSSGVGSLIAICNTLKKQSAKLAISGVHGSVKKVIELTKLTTFFPLANSLEDALKRVK